MLYHFPPVSTRFIGRATEVATLAQQLEIARLVTIVGAGGSGKTRLAIETARRVAGNFSGGAYFVDLAPLNDAALIPTVIAAAFDLRDQAGHSIRHTLFHALAEKNFLLLLDNCEHLRDASAEFLPALLAACANARVLATSRAVMGISAEKIFSLSPMLSQDAMSLFADRAQSVSPVFQRGPANENAIAELCARLDNLPLAVELAAARAKMLAPAQIAARLDARFEFLKNHQADVPARQTTLRATLEWSDELLPEPARELFYTLGVFAGSFDLDAVTQVSGRNEIETLDRLTHLAEQSLLVVEPASTETRYRLLETTREYAREKLSAAGNLQNARANLFAYSLALAERAEQKFSSREESKWVTRLDAEQDNFRAALYFALDSSQVEMGLRLANALWGYWEIVGRYQEGRNWFDALLAHSNDAVMPDVKARALFCAGALHYRLLDLKRAQAFGEASLELRRALHNATDISKTLNLLGLVASDMGEYAHAETLHQEALALRRHEENPLEIAASLKNLGYNARHQGKFQQARAFYAESLDIERTYSGALHLAVTLSNLGELEILSGHFAYADMLLTEALALSEQTNSTYMRAQVLKNLCVVRRAQGDAAAARVLANELIALAQQIGGDAYYANARLNLADIERDEGNLTGAAAIYAEAVSAARQAHAPHSLAPALNGLGVIWCLQGEVSTAAAYHREALHIYHAAQYPLGIAETLERLSGVALAWKEPARALEWLGAARALRAEMGAPVFPFDRPSLDEIVTRATQSLGDSAAAKLLQGGYGMSMQILLESVDAWHVRATTVTAGAIELELFAFGETRVFRHGRLLDSRAWRYAQAQEVVFYLLTRGAVSKEQFALDLYPDASPVQIRNTMHRILHHARGALGKSEWLAFKDGEYRFNRALPYAYDVEQFAQALAQAQAHGDDDARIEDLQRAVQLYAGDFLNDLDGSEWIFIERELRREQFLNAALELGDRLYATARYAQAVEIYGKILTHENLIERAHRGLMSCHARLGDADRARKQYLRLTELLQEELHAPPSAETQRLYEKIKRGEAF